MFKSTRPKVRATLLSTLILSTVGLAALAGSALAANKPYKITLLSASNVIPGWHGYDRGAKAEAKKLGVDLTITQWASLQPSDLVAGINAVAASKPDAALFSAVSDKAEQPALEQAANRIKKIVIFDSPAVDPSAFATYVGSPAAEEGKAAADVLAKLVGKKGTVLEIDAAPSFSTLEINMRAFRSQMATYKGIKLLPLQYDGGDTSKNAAIVRATLSRYPDLVGIYLGTSGLGAEGGVSAVRAAGKIGKVKLITLDGLPAAISDLAKGYQQAVIAANVEQIGANSVSAAVNALNGKKLPKSSLSGYCVLTKANLAQAKSKQCIYASTS